MPDLPLAFAELLVGGVILEAALKGAGVADVVRGTATSTPITGLDATAATATAAGAGTVAATATAGVNSLFSAGTPPANLAGAPPKVVAAWQRATGMAALGAPYNNGAGHASAFTAPLTAIKSVGTDCSGFVSSVLGPLGAGVLTSPQTTQGIYDQPGMADGAGKYITIYDRHTGAVNQEHVIMSIAGQFFESGGQLGKGPTEMSDANARSELAGGGFQVYHPAGM